MRVTAFWPMSASDTFTLRYRALGAAKRYLDTGELYWQFIGDGWGAPTRKAGILVTLPRPLKKSQVRAWGHGPLNGSVTIRPGGSVFYSVRDVPPETFVEGRILFPAAALSKAPVVDRDEAASAVAQEKKWADEANALRRRVTAEREAAARSETVWRAVGLAAPALLVLLLLLLTLTKGLGYRLGGRARDVHGDPRRPPAGSRRHAVGVRGLRAPSRAGDAPRPRPARRPRARAGPGASRVMTRTSRATASASPAAHAKEMTGYEHALVSLLFRDAVNDGPVSIDAAARVREEGPRTGGQPAAPVPRAGASRWTAAG